MVGGSDLASVSHVNDLSKSAGHSGALRRNGNLRRAPHPDWLKAGKPEIRKQTQKSPSSFGKSDGPMTERCEGSAMTFGKQASTAYRRHIGSPVQRKRRARFDACVCTLRRFRAAILGSR